MSKSAASSTAFISSCSPRKRAEVRLFRCSEVSSAASGFAFGGPSGGGGGLGRVSASFSHCLIRSRSMVSTKSSTASRRWFA